MEKTTSKYLKIFRKIFSFGLAGVFWLSIGTGETDELLFNSKGV